MRDEPGRPSAPANKYRVVAWGVIGLIILGCIWEFGAFGWLLAIIVGLIVALNGLGLRTRLANALPFFRTSSPVVSGLAMFLVVGTIWAGLLFGVYRPQSAAKWAAATQTASVPTAGVAAVAATSPTAGLALVELDHTATAEPLTVAVDTATPVPSTNTPIPPTDTPVPPTDTPVPPTDTPAPTDTAVPPTETPIEPTATLEPPTETPDPNSIENLPKIDDGTYVVGDDVQPGIYRSINSTERAGCYWARLAGFSGELDDIIANDNAVGNELVEIKETDAGFETSGCAFWILVPGGVGVGDGSDFPFESGTYFVGTDLKPGTWKSEGGDTCYWERLSGFGGELDDIIANDNPEGPAIVTIESSDRGFSSSFCGEWEYVGD